MVVVRVPWSYQRYDREIYTIEYPGSTQSTTTTIMIMIMIMMLVRSMKMEGGTAV
jgi:hypothetical protein